MSKRGHRGSVGGGGRGSPRGKPPTPDHLAPRLVPAVMRYFTHGHNVDGCLRNGSFVRVHPDGLTAQFMNGDFMGTIDAVPDGMVEVDTDYARELIPRCCR